MHKNALIITWFNIKSCYYVVLYLFWIILPWLVLTAFTVIVSSMYVLETSCCKKWEKKNPNQETGFGNRGRLKVLNGTKLALNEHEWPLNHLGSIWYHSEPFSFFPNQSLGWDIFAASFSKTALPIRMWIIGWIMISFRAFALTWIHSAVDRPTLEDVFWIYVSLYCTNAHVYCRALMQLLEVDCS